VLCSLHKRSLGLSSCTWRIWVSLPSIWIFVACKISSDRILKQYGATGTGSPTGRNRRPAPSSVQPYASSPCTEQIQRLLEPSRNSLLRYANQDRKVVSFIGRAGVVRNHGAGQRRQFHMKVKILTRHHLLS
jgi:hypothetical protein